MPGDGGEICDRCAHPAGRFPAYTDLVKIGRGGSSTVYRARSAAFARDVAIKIFHGTVDDPGLQARFRRECRVLGSLGDHPHVVSVFDSGFTADRRPYIVMPHCSGGSLGQRLTAHGPRPADEAVAVGLAVADALGAAHARGVVHRDVKPHNVLLTSWGVVTLADFGVAAAGAPDLTSLAATPGYAAPEVILDHTATSPAADVYALGATLFALLTGGPPVRPLPDESDLAFMVRAAEAPAPTVPAHVPGPVAAVLQACLSRDPALRPPSARRVAGDLRLAAAAADLTPPERLDLLDLPSSAAVAWERPDGVPRFAPDTPTYDSTLTNRRRGPALAAAVALALGTAGVLAALMVGSATDGGGRDAGSGTAGLPAPDVVRTGTPAAWAPAPTAPATGVTEPVTRASTLPGAGPSGGLTGVGPSAPRAASPQVTATVPAPASTPTTAPAAGDNSGPGNSSDRPKKPKGDKSRGPGEIEG